jgi:dethiobiotin synthetase|tara:strand:- start:488 stop:1222 length:735 start_codon:yes stop_codon:yes gene_type:complete
MILFITGNDTNIGKTFVTALLTNCLSQKYKSIAVVKPIESGVSSRNKSDLKLIKALNRHNLDKLDFFNFYSFKQPLAPLTASILTKTNIKKGQITKNIHKLSKLYDLVIVEGMGGLRVPIGKNFEVIDLISALKARTILVILPSLGTINHTLLSVEALKRRKIKLEGVVINRYPKRPNISELYNPVILEENGIKILGVVPKLLIEKLKKTEYSAKKWFTPLLNGEFQPDKFLATCKDKFSKISR